MPGRVCHGPRRSAEAGGIEDAILNASVAEDYEACWIQHAALVICLSYAADTKNAPSKMLQGALNIVRFMPSYGAQNLVTQPTWAQPP